MLFTIKLKLIKAILKRCVFNFALKSSTVEQSLTESGREFQSLGAAQKKDLSPFVSVLVFGMAKKLRLLERSLRAGVY